MSDRQPGKVVTFYSYKGGTGRSMALANVAWVLASNGKRVLVVDWDLEAPGLHRYFAPFLVDYQLTASDGVIDFVSKYADAVLTPPADDNHHRQDWYRAYAKITNLATSLTWTFDFGGTLDFIGAGRQGPLYAGRVSNFPWQAFYERLGGGDFLDATREDMVAEYDYVLLDSRTGVSDTAGICTMHLPDALVICFTLNNQSVAGAADIARIISQKPGKVGMPIYPLAARIELTERSKLEARRRYARSRFALFPNHMSTSERDAYWGAMEIRYEPYYAYEELLAPFGDLPGQEASLLAAMERLTSYLSGGEVTRLQPIPERVRLLYRDRYASQSDEVVREADRLLTSFSDEDQISARRILTRLVRVARVDEGDLDTRARAPVGEFSDVEDVLRTLAAAGIITVQSDPGLGEELVELADETLVQRWPTLCQWVDEDRTFLLWRQQFRSALAEWERNNGALLSGRPLLDAKGWLEERSRDLTDRERTYIHQSALVEETERAREEAERLLLFDELAKLQKRNAQLMEADRAVDGITLRPHAFPSTWLSRVVLPRLLAGTVALLIVSFFTWRSMTSSNLREQRVVSLVAAGDSTLAQGNSSIARSRYDSALAYDSLFAPAYLGRGAIYEIRERADSAFLDYSRAIALDSSSARAYYLRGRISREIGDFESARRDLSRAAALNPRNPDILVEQGSVYEAMKRPDSALFYYSAAIALDSGLVGAYEGRGRIYALGGDRQRALSDFQRALSVVGADDVTRLRLTSAVNTLTSASPDQASLTSVVPAVAARITLQYQTEVDVAAVSNVYNMLRSHAGWRVNVPEKVLPAGDNTAEVYGGVRFFYPEDRELGVRVCEAVSAELHRQGYDVALPLWPMVRGTREGLFHARPGLIEVWISPLPPSQGQSVRRSTTDRDCRVR